MSKKQFAFTLIELLVVIAIIGILSGLIVVAMSGITNKATIAKAQVFSNSLKNSSMLSLVSEWKFDGSGISSGSSIDSSYLIDSWGQKNGTVTATPPTVLSDADCVSGSCLNFNGSQNVTIPYNSIFNFGNQMTAMIWVKMGVQSSQKGIFDQWSGTNNAWWIGVLGAAFNKVEVLISDDGTTNANHYKYYVTNNVVFDGNWHLIGFTWNAGTFFIYVDGQSVPLAASGTLTTNSIYNSTSNLAIGWHNTAGSYITGSVDEARLYSVAIPTSQVKEQYYAGLNELFINGGITKEEYLSRINNIAKL